MSPEEARCLIWNKRGGEEFQALSPPAGGWMLVEVFVFPSSWSTVAKIVGSRASLPGFKSA